MKINFSWKRFSLVLKNQFAEHRSKYSLYILGILLIGLIINCLLLFMNNWSYSDYAARNWQEIQGGIYLSGLYIFAGIFACTSFVDFNNKGEAIFYMIKPASIVEKWLVQVLIHTIVFFVIYTLLFYSLNISFTGLVNSIRYYDYNQAIANKTYYDNVPVIDNVNGVNTTKPTIEPFVNAQIFKFIYFKESFKESFKEMYLVYSLFISIYFTGIAFFMYGAVLFNKFSFFKTLFAGFILGIIYLIYELFLNSTQHTLLGNDWRFNLTSASNYVDSNYLKVAYSDESMYVLAYSLLIFVPITMLICSYFQLKEKEI